ncbi:hypothetical protein GCM10009678_33390 [Actinomadura kijaniata]|uniref:Uncharacterized protein n=1 Tax=Actinomadura namibiensis TaxID=182080 RepID=A0A7W3LMS6_ACTNM|nr:hypothetical protein [Actinomadura namibiensis]MBA8951016.1 hypothetical protein [Actinomadura namibiensis]
MSDGFMVAARIAMTREGFDRWLDTPAPGPDAIANPGEMFDGWFWDGRRADTGWRNAAVGVTPRDFFAERVRRVGSGASVLLYREGALEAYLFDVGYVEREVHTALLMFAAAGAFKTEPASDAVLFWAEAGGGLREPDWRGWLAVLSVDEDLSRFTPASGLPRAALADSIAALRPVEDRFFQLVERLGEEEESWDWESGEAFTTTTPRDELFVDPEVLRRPER